jgi:membrane protein YdbS with pleckstrin-like domain
LPRTESAVQTDGAARAAARSLDPRLVTVHRIGGAIFGAIVCLIHLVTAVTLWLTRGWHPDTIILVTAWPLVTAFLAWLAIAWPAISFRYRRYRVDRAGIEIWTGVVWRQVIAVPRSRVQHIDVSQGPIERAYGLATLSIHTAGTAYSKVDLPGLDHPTALAVRDALLPKDAERAV